MAEVLYQLLQHDGELPVLAIRDEFEASERPLGQGYELELRDPAGDAHEVDMFASDGYRLWIGEANKGGRFAPGRLEFIASLAILVDAYGVLLATSKRRWPPSTEQEARSAFRGFWPEVRMRAGVATRP